LEVLGGGLQMFLNFSSKGTMCEDSTYFDVLIVPSLAYLSQWLNFQWYQTFDHESIANHHGLVVVTNGIVV
jgi:hypothetical protein